MDPPSWLGLELCLCKERLTWVCAVGVMAKRVLQLSAAPSWDDGEKTEMGSLLRCPVMEREVTAQGGTKEIPVRYKEECFSL